MNKQESETVVKKGNKWIVALTVLFVAALIILAILFVLFKINSNGMDDKLQEQLDLGEKYLSELAYEQAIVSYEEAINIDPKSVEAYLGLADVYVAMEEYDKAISVLEDGYAATGDEEIKRRLDELTEQMSDVSENDTEVDEIPIVQIGDITYASYYKYDLTEEEKTYLESLIALLEEGAYAQAIEFLDYDKSTQIAVKEFPTEDGGIINCIYKDRKIYIHTYDLDSVYINIMPIENGTGYSVKQCPTEGTHIRSSCVYGECENGMYNGEYEYWLYDEGNMYIAEKGTAVNNLLHGDVYTYHEGEDYVDKVTYSEGRLVYYDLGPYDGDYESNYSYASGVRIYEDGEESVLHALGYSEDLDQVREEIESKLYTMQRIESFYCEVPKGETYYHPW